MAESIILTDEEMEVARLGEESMFIRRREQFCWKYIKQNASPGLQHLMQEKETFGKNKCQKLLTLIRKNVKEEFDRYRAVVRQELNHGGFRGGLAQASYPHPETMVTGMDGSGDILVSSTSSSRFSSRQQLSGEAQEELAWLGEESILASGGKKSLVTDWDFIERHASAELRDAIEVRKNSRRSYRNFYAYLPLQSNREFKEAFERKRSEIRQLLLTGYRRSETADFLPSAPDSTTPGVEEPEHTDESRKRQKLDPDGERQHQYGGLTLPRSSAAYAQVAARAPDAKGEGSSSSEQDEYLEHDLDSKGKGAASEPLLNQLEQILGEMRHQRSSFKEELLQLREHHRRLEARVSAMENLENRVANVISTVGTRE